MDITWTCIHYHILHPSLYCNLHPSLYCNLHPHIPRFIVINKLFCSVPAFKSANQTVFMQIAPKSPFRFTATPASYIYPIYLVMAYTPFIQFLLIKLVTEKEKKIKQGMEIMGLKVLSLQSHILHKGKSLSTIIRTQHVIVDFSLTKCGNFFLFVCHRILCTG